MKSNLQEILFFNKETCSFRLVIFFDNELEELPEYGNIQLLKFISDCHLNLGKC